jgi:hypothetical protein
MDTLATVVEILKGLGTPAITIVGFVWLLAQMKKLSSDIAGVKTDMTKLEAKLSSDIAGVKADVATLEAKVISDIAGLRADVRSIKLNHLPHIEAAMNELAKGTPNEAHVKAILDLSHKADREYE